MNWLSSIGKALIGVPWWLSPAAQIAVAIITWVYLHDAKRGSTQWWARTIVIFLMVAGAAGALGQQVRQSHSQEAIAWLERTVHAQDYTITDLKKRALTAERELRIEDAALRSATANIADARKRVIDIHYAIASVGIESRAADLEAKNASVQANAVMSTVHRSNLETTRRLRLAEALANQAAARAGVYHIPPALTRGIFDALSNATPGVADIGCSPGLESACSDLRAIFARAGWKTQIAFAASFWGGFEASGTGADSDAGIDIWYHAGRDEPAQMMADAFRRSGLGVDMRPLLGNSGYADIQISFRFVSKH